MKIAFDGRILTQKSITGVQRYGFEVEKQLREMLADGTFFTLYPSGSSKLSKHFWEHFILPKEASSQKAEILFCPGNIAPTIGLGKIKLVTVIHDLSYLYYPKAYSAFFKIYYHLLIPRIFKRSDVLITVSESEKQKILNYYPNVANKLFVIPNGIGSDFYEEKIQKENIILYVGSLSTRKNFQGVIASFLKVYKEIPHKLVLIGSFGDIFGKDRNTANLIRHIPPERLSFIGQINDVAELRKWYSKSACLFFPSFYESSGLPPTEAMACGCPVLVSDIPALKERCAEAAIYCDPYLIEDMVQKLLKITSSEKLQQELKLKGLQQVEKFSWKKTAEQTIEIFKQLVR